MKQILLYIWQLPQNLLGLLLLGIYKLFDKKCVKYSQKEDVVYYATKLMPSGISLGKYVIMRYKYGEHYKDYRHEFGHTKQSKMLGWFYLLVIGLPSLCGNIVDRIFNKGYKWYYNQPWEKWADKLGVVIR